MKYYTGNITPEPDTIFVFGSNPEGRHGSGSAKVARLQFGAIYGQGEGLREMPMPCQPPNCDTRTRQMPVTPV